MPKLYHIKAMKLIAIAATVALALIASPSIAGGPSAIFSVQVLPAGNAGVVQAITTHGTGILSGGPDGTQKFVWPFTAVQDFRGVTATPIGSGHSLVGYIHLLSAQGTTIWPRAITDNLGNSYNVTPSQLWYPYVTAPGEGENIGIFYLANIPGGAKTLTFDFTQYSFGSGHDAGGIDAGFIEFSGVNGVNQVVDPFDAGSVQNPSLTITPTALSRIWVLGATNSGPGDGSDLVTPGYTDLMPYEEAKDGIGIWISDATIPATTQTLTWQNDYWNTATCADNTPAGPTGCTVILGAVALSIGP